MGKKAASAWRFAGAMALCGGVAGSAWAGGLPDCPVAPFADVSIAQYAARLSGACQHESSRWKLETPRAKPADVGPSLLRAEFSTLASVPMPISSLLGSLKFDWAGLRSSDTGGSLRTQRTALSLGGLLRLHERLVLQTNVGMEHTDVPRSRATISSVWQPVKRGVLFAEWAGSETGTEAHRVGARLWLVRSRLAVELGARHLPDGMGWVDQRVGLALKLAL
jgi:hypothetical protein